MTTERTPFTNVTWASVRQLDASTPRLDWEALTDLAYELAATTGLPIEWCRILVDAAVNGCPVVLTTKVGDGTETCTGVVRELRGIVGTYNPMYFSTWGFYSPISFRDITNVAIPERVYGD